MARTLLHLFRRSATPDRELTPYEEKVKSSLESLEAYARSHGGTIDLVEAEEGGDISVRFGGNCRGCPMSEMTLRQGVEAHLRREFPDLRNVVRVD